MSSRRFRYLANIPGSYVEPSARSMMSDYVPVVELRHGGRIEGLPDLPHKISRKVARFLVIQGRLVSPLCEAPHSGSSLRMPLKKDTEYDCAVRRYLEGV